MFEWMNFYSKSAPSRLSAPSPDAHAFAAGADLLWRGEGDGQENINGD